MATFKCTIITPDRKIFDDQADFVALPAHDGEIGILPGRAPLLCKLGIGLLRMQIGNDTRRMYVDEGFAQMQSNELIVLTQQAQKPDEVDLQAERDELAEAQAVRTTESEALAERRRAIDRAKAKIKLAT